MTYIAKPLLHHPSLERNAVGFTRRDYEGRISTLCAGCGHDSISASPCSRYSEGPGIFGAHTKRERCAASDQPQSATTSL